MAELLSVATALPPHHLTRAGTLALLPRLVGSEAAAARFRPVVENSRVERRYFVVPPDDLLRLEGPAGRSEVYEREAVELGEQVSRSALVAASVDPADVGALVSVSCTGYMQPSFDAYLMPRLGISETARRLPITELGCAAGVAGLAMAAALVTSTSCPAALLVSVELCSLCAQTAAPSDAEAIGNLLFGDAAAAVVVSGETRGRGPEVIASRSVLWPNSTEMLGMRLGDTGLRLGISPDLPDAVRRYLPSTLATFLAAAGLSREALSFWIVHPGGPKVLEAVGECLRLGEGDLQPSWDVWQRCGNVSSATVLFILSALRGLAPLRDGALGVMIAFGPGLTCELVLLRAGGWLSEDRGTR